VKKTNVRCNLTAIVWKDTQNVDILMDMHSAPLEGNICNEHSKAVTLDIYNKTIIDTQNMWTDLTTLQTATVLAEKLGRGERSLSSILCTLPFSTASSISHLVVQIHRTDNYTDIGERLNTRGGNGALTTGCNTRQAPSMKNPKRLDSIHNRRWLIQCKH